MAQARRRIVWGLIGALAVAVGWLGVMAWADRIGRQDQPLGHIPAGPADDGPTETELDEAEALAEPSDQPPGPAWMLVGTVVASDRRWSRASIAGPGGKTGLYRIGDRLMGGARVTAIGDDWARLEDEHGSILLRLAEPKRALAGPVDEPRDEPGPPEDPGAPADPVAANQDPPDSESEPIYGLQQVRPGIFRIRRDALERRLADPADLFRGVTPALVFDAEGQVTGVRLQLAADSFLTRLGLQDGDVIQRIGSLLVDSTASLERITALLANAREVDLEFTRAGQTMHLRYWLDP